MSDLMGFESEEAMRAALGLGPEEFAESAARFRSSPQRQVNVRYNPQTRKVERVDHPDWYEDIWDERQDQPNFGPGAGGTGGVPGPDEDGMTDKDRENQRLRDRANALFGWLPEPLLRIFRQEWVRSGGDRELALNAMRQSSEYEQFFPGNKREDGTVRHREQEYQSIVEGYERAFSTYEIPIDIVESRIPDLIRGNVRVPTLQDRLDFTFANVASQSNNIQRYYAELEGIDVSHAAIMSSVIRPDLPISQLEQKVRQAHIGATAMDYDFDIAHAESRRLEQFGLDRESAQRLYSTAASQLPTLQTLVDRHNDPDDTFSIDEFTDALVMEDPDSLRRIQRLFGQEQAQFAGQGQLARSQETGGITGLRQI